jgi:RNA polymerase sigma-70 factor, ECF subfamily
LLEEFFEMVDQVPEIVQLGQAGEQALADALSFHAPRLLRIVELRIDPRLAGRVDAADVLQETFLEARKRLSATRQPGGSSRFWMRWTTWTGRC